MQQYYKRKPVRGIYITRASEADILPVMSIKTTTVYVSQTRSTNTMPYATPGPCRPKTQINNVFVMFLFSRVNICQLFCIYFPFNCIYYICASDGLDFLPIFCAAHISPSYKNNLRTRRITYILSPSHIHNISFKCPFFPSDTFITTFHPSSVCLFYPSRLTQAKLYGAPSLPPLPGNLCTVQLSTLLHPSSSLLPLPGHLPSLHL